MLLHLHIRQFAIVAELEVTFGLGLNVISGETGAGKSVLINALKLVLGGRARPDMVRSGAEHAEIEALFDITDEPAVKTRLNSIGIPSEDELVIRRWIGASGRSRAYINGRMATANQLSELAIGLVDISSQHEHHTLVDSNSHLGYLDAFGGHESAVASLRTRYAVLSEAVVALHQQQQKISERSEREDLLRFQLQEIERVRPKPDEETALADEISRLRHADRLGRATSFAEEALYAGEDTVVDRLGRISGELEEAARIDPSLRPLLERLETSRIEIEEVARELGLYARDTEADPARLAEAEERLHALRRLIRKYGGSTEAVLKHGQWLETELNSYHHAEEHIELLEQRVEQLRSVTATEAIQLSKRRQAAAKQLSLAITTELASLGMGGARVEVAMALLEEGDPALTVEGARLSPTGIDRVEFLIAPNRGEEPKPLRRVASGGELSRSLLALKRVLSGHGPVGTYVFDEVDSGVGGAVAEVIGHKLREIASHHQVLCITHLPQVAALGQTHLYVKKGEVEGRTLSTIVPLTKQDRVEELARMLGGLTITDVTRQAAAEMLARSHH